MKLIIYLVILFGMFSCSQKLLHPNIECNQTNAVFTAENYLKKKKLYDENLKPTIEETSTQYIITFLHNDVNRKGGGGKFTLSKENCSILKMELYQ